jgi:putative flavoprotein involved in K+ transport
MERIDVAIVGAGQAGLAVSHELTAADIEHVVLERGRVGQTWRDRWDSFCLVTPNWAIRLPGGLYDGDDPHGYLPRDEIVEYLERYATGFGAPVRDGVAVDTIERRDGFVLRTSSGPIVASSIVLASGAYQRPHRPAGSDTLPSDLLLLDAEGYRSPSALPDGRVLVIGSGQTGCQLAEELHEAGRDVVLACGRAPWVPRRLGGLDIVWWVDNSGFMSQTAAALPSPQARLWANILSTGHGGGHDLHLRTLRSMGVTLTGHFLGADDHRARFALDLADSVTWGDERYRQLKRLFQKYVLEAGLDPIEIADPEPFEAEGPDEVDLHGFGTAIVTSGFRPDYGALVPWPGALDDMGFPVHRNGQSTVVPGLFFVGVHFLRTRKSSLLMGVGDDAAVIASQIAARAGAR